MAQTLEVARNAGRVVFIGINLREDIPVALGKFQVKGITAKMCIRDREMPIDQIKKIVFQHPTVCEIIREAIWQI